MFSSFIDCLQEKNYITETPVSAYHNTPCDNCTVTLIDMQEIKTKYSQTTGEATPPTVNGLVLDENGRLYFVELSQYYVNQEQFSKRYLTDGGDDYIRQKIEGTIEVLKSVNAMHNCDDELDGKVDDVKAIVVTEMSDADYVPFRLGFSVELGITSRNEVGILNCEKFSEIFG